MAPAAEIPEVDMSLMQETDIQQSYWLMFEKMKDDFVTKDDLDLILKSALVNGGSVIHSWGSSPVIAAHINAVVTDQVARAKAKVYAQLAKTGGVVRESTIGALEGITS